MPTRTKSLTVGKAAEATPKEFAPDISRGEQIGLLGLQFGESLRDPRFRSGAPQRIMAGYQPQAAHNMQMRVQQDSLGMIQSAFDRDNPMALDDLADQFPYADTTMFAKVLEQRYDMDTAQAKASAAEIKENRARAKYISDSIWKRGKGPHRLEAWEVEALTTSPSPLIKMYKGEDGGVYAEGEPDDPVKPPATAEQARFQNIQAMSQAVAEARAPYEAEAAAPNYDPTEEMTPGMLGPMGKANEAGLRAAEPFMQRDQAWINYMEAGRRAKSGPGSEEDLGYKPYYKHSQNVKNRVSTWLNERSPEEQESLKAQAQKAGYPDALTMLANSGLGQGPETRGEIKDAAAKVYQTEFEGSYKNPWLNTLTEYGAALKWAKNIYRLALNNQNYGDVPAEAIWRQFELRAGGTGAGTFENADQFIEEVKSQTVKEVNFPRREGGMLSAGSAQGPGEKDFVWTRSGAR